MNPGQARGDLRAPARANPAPTTELGYRTPFELLVAVILSAQATDKSVNLATPRSSRWPTRRQKMLALGDGRADPIHQTIGSYRSQGEAHHRGLPAARRATRRRSARETREALEQLPGVGRKTANVILNIAFGQPTIAVDTHIFRVANRTGIAPGKQPARSRSNGCSSSSPSASARTRTTG